MPYERYHLHSSDCLFRCSMFVRSPFIVSAAVCEQIIPRIFWKIHENFIGKNMQQYVIHCGMRTKRWVLIAVSFIFGKEFVIWKWWLQTNNLKRWKNKESLEQWFHIMYLYLYIQKIGYDSFIDHRCTSKTHVPFNDVKQTKMPYTYIYDSIWMEFVVWLDAHAVLTQSSMLSHCMISDLLRIREFSVKVSYFFSSSLFWVEQKEQIKPARVSEVKVCKTPNEPNSQH